jgi:hypothetical protein
LEEFAGYKHNEEWWFVIYLRLAEAISKNPSLSAKNSDISEYFEIEGLERWERKELESHLNGKNGKG